MSFVTTSQRNDHVYAPAAYYSGVNPIDPTILSVLLFNNNSGRIGSYFGCRGRDLDLLQSSQNPKPHDTDPSLPSTYARRSMEVHSPETSYWLHSPWNGSCDLLSLPSSYTQSPEEHRGASMSRSTMSKPSKRSWLTRDSPEVSSESVSSEEPRRKAPKIDDLKPQKPQYACPFFKRDPAKHQDCMTLTLRRIKDVKQHLRRRHGQPDHYCHHCYETFPNPRQQDDHILSKACICVKEISDAPWISEGQNQRLHQTVPRSLDPEERWHWIWDIIFPNQGRPESAFMDRHLEGTTLPLQEVWKSQGHEILDSVFENAATEGVAIQRREINSIVTHVLDRLKNSISGDGT